ncbi:hypothetical protein [Neoroseomonas soli]|uniref:Polysaccharide chain length determinant N-terminal domain-containing protein n=1 Tax=Neoroseomonas soli TaxID=1081025 RepID=A0A9X9WX68_9PROT|nr:hypothetical protein [Neoroseomonas soli]MBR0671747.1 hypothetical protein [Neoroseomonas soli]
MQGVGTAVIGARPKTTWLPTDLFGVLALARRYWLLMLGCALAGAVALLASAVLIGGPRYIVAAKIMVNLGPEMAGSPLLATLQGTPSAPAMLRPEDSATGVEIFSNPRLVRDLVESLGPDFFADDPPVTFLQHVKYIGKQAMRGVQRALQEVTVALGLRPRITETDRLVLARSAGPFDEAWHEVIDLWLFCRMCLAGDIGHLDRVLVEYRVHPAAMSQQMSTMNLMFRRQITAARQAFAWLQSVAIGASGQLRQAELTCARTAVEVLHLTRRGGYERFAASLAEIVREVPAVLAEPATWARIGFGLLPQGAIVALSRRRQDRARARAAQGAA